MTMTVTTVPHAGASTPEDAPPLSAALDLGNLRARIAAGHVEVKRHSDADLAILDYSRRCQFDAAWDHETMMCRGLIVTTRGGAVDALSRIVARPYAKFFTVDQHAALAAAGVVPPLPFDDPFEVFTKEDGSMGVGYWAPDGRPAISTRGSFTSTQAIWATGFVRADPGLEEALAAMLVTGTPCFEIISPVSRIVKRYDFDGLVLHGLLDRRTGADLPLPSWPGPVAAAHEPAAIAELAARDVDNEEGFVLRFASGVRAKVKFATYLRLHAVVTGCSTRTLWEHLAVASLRDAGTSEKSIVSRLHIDHRFVASMMGSSGDPIEQILDRVPDEFDTWVRTQVASIRDAFATRARFYTHRFSSIRAGLARRDFVEAVRDWPKWERSAMFEMFDGRSIDHMIWLDVAPDVPQLFTVDLDA